MNARTPLLAICTVILVLALLYAAQPILAPVAFACFTIAVVSSLPGLIGRRIGRPLALIGTILITVAAVALLGALVVWGLGRVGRWTIDNAAMISLLYAQLAQRLAAYGFDPTTILGGQFDLAWLLVAARKLLAGLQDLVTFILLVLVFVVLGLLELDLMRRKLLAMGERGAQALATLRLIAWKFQRYMLVRTAVSLLTGVLVGLFAYIFGLELAVEWGVIAFALNYIPFIGPLVATALPTLVAGLQFGALGSAAFVCLGLYAIQTLVGSYLEPRLAGAALSISPFLVLFAVFFWSFLWGIAGAVIGIPIVIAAVTACARIPSLAWIGQLLAGEPEA